MGNVSVREESRKSDSEEINFKSMILSGVIGIPDWIKMILYRSLISSILFIVVTQIAVYWYAIKYGARPPLEGVSFLIIFSIAAGGGLSVASVLAALTKASQSPAIIQYFNQRTILAWTISTILSVFIVLAYYPLLYLLLQDLSTQREVSFLYINFFGLRIYSIFYIVILMIFVMPSVQFISIVIPRNFLPRFYSKIASKQTVATAFALYTIVGAFLLQFFLSDGFSSLLRLTQYGGGVIVDVKTRSEVYERASLFVVTTRRTILWQDQSKQFIEINNEHGVSVSYEPRGVSYKLPPKLTPSGILGDLLPPQEETRQKKSSN